MKKHASRTVFVFLILMYAVASVILVFISRSDAVLTIAGQEIPYASFTGVLSWLANIALIFLVFYFGKPGFILSLVISFLQIPSMVLSLVMVRNLQAIVGLFSNLFTVITIIFIYRRNKQIAKLQETEVETLKAQQQFSQRLFEQTVTALVNAVDAKDTYSHGHSLRVAEYSEKIARALGKSDSDCERIYYTALLHDVGKIGISDAIINKVGKLTPEEYDVIKQHPVMGNQILSSISEYPYLSIGAHYHHERYDGAGYPEGLKGEDIPEVARIISVADAYDAMTSNRSYRNAIPQQLVREEIVKGVGTQFDPDIAKVMQHLIDHDVEYKMKERNALKELAGRNELKCEEYRSKVSDGIQVLQNMTTIDLRYTQDPDAPDASQVPSIILFDSLDGRIHKHENTIKELNYFEYCEIRFDGETSVTGARKIQSETQEHTPKDNYISGTISYHLEAVKIKDHVLITIDDTEKTVKVTVALPDNSRFVYIGLTGAYCLIHDVSIQKAEKNVPDDYIERIAEEISYIDGPVGDFPNVQVDGYRTASTKGILITDGMKLKFHTKSLPTARLIWHCPYLDIFYSRDSRIGGPNYREYSLIRLDGENWKSKVAAENKLIANRTDEFGDWDDWKRGNKEGYDCVVNFTCRGSQLITTTENLGLSIRNTTKITDGTKDIYVAITGDQVALTNIRIER